MGEQSLRVGEAIREYREARGISARRLSLDAGLSESYVGRIESGESGPSLRAFAKLAVVLRMKPAEVYTIVCQEARES